MRVAVFGGTFDPVHLGHLAVARAAAEKFKLNQIYFVPADLPPHKQKRKLTDFQHRFAMLALATIHDKRFVPSLLDAHTGRPNYSIDTVRRVKQGLKRLDKMYFLIGMDAFKEIATWRQPEELLAECEFIVASRPGFFLADIGKVLPESLRPSPMVLSAMKKSRSNEMFAVPGVTVHLLSEVDETVSSTQIRAAASKTKGQLTRYVPRLVAEYIRKQRLYVPGGKAAKGVLPDKVLSFQEARTQKV
jgi:nicotinate-nucleotide adenylyltransferase